MVLPEFPNRHRGKIDWPNFKYRFHGGFGYQRSLSFWVWRFQKLEEVNSFFSLGLKPQNWATEMETK